MNTKIIDATIFLNNLKEIQKRAQKELCVMVKADAYGHGLKEIASCLQNTPYVCGVFSQAEGIDLRKYLPKHRICVFGMLEDVKTCVEQGLEISVHSLQQAKQYYTEGKKRGLCSALRVHIAIDTGMHRFGLQQRKELCKTYAFCKKHFTLCGIYTHFCTIDTNLPFFKQQQALFQESLQKLGERLAYATHVGGGLCLDATPSSMLRVGLLAYGYGAPWVKPCLQIKTQIMEMKTLHKGDMLGYNEGFIATETMRVGIVPLGYGDGIDMRLKDHYAFMVNGTERKIIGNVCMDCCFIPLQKKDNVGDEVCALPANRWAEQMNASVYEVLCNLKHMRAYSKIKQ